MQLHHYIPTTGEYLATSAALPSPLEPGEYQVIAYATPAAPPSVGLREVARYITADGSVPEHHADGAWQRCPDWRGVSLYSTEDGREVTIDTIGAMPADVQATEQPRPSPDYSWDGVAWVFDPVLHQQRLAGLRDAARSSVNVWRDAQEQAPLVFEHAGRRWDAGLRVRDRLRPTLNAAKQAGALPEGFFWTDADNVDVPMTVPQLELLAEAHEAALVAHGWKIHARQRAMKQEIEAMDEVALSAFVPTWSIA